MMGPREAAWRPKAAAEASPPFTLQRLLPYHEDGDDDDNGDGDGDCHDDDDEKEEYEKDFSGGDTSPL